MPNSEFKEAISYCSSILIYEDAICDVVDVINMIQTSERGRLGTEIRSHQRYLFASMSTTLSRALT